MRLVKCNQLDLTVFQFDFDLTFAVFFLNAHRTVYARYGTRNSMESADRDVSLDGLAAAMKTVLQIHAEFPANRASLRGKQPKSVEKLVPEDFAALSQYKPQLDYEGQVTKSCIHCHQLRDAQRLSFRAAGNPIPTKLLFPYPAPQSIGLTIDPLTRATISAVEPNSLAANSGFKQGDEIEEINDQVIASIADLQWVLHYAADNDDLDFSATRDGNPVDIKLSLPKGWRASSNISWRPTTWDLRRMTTGGMVLESLSEKEKRELNLDPDQMALRVTHVGQYGKHAVAKRAGIKKHDIITSFDGQTKLFTESRLIQYAMNQKNSGDVVALTYRRNGRSRKVNIKLQ